MTNHTPLRLIAKKAAAHTHTSMSKLSLYVQVFFSPSLSLFLAVFDALVCVFLCPYMLTVCESGKKKKKVRSAGSPTSNTEQKRAAQRNSLSIKKKEERKNPLTKQRCVLLQITADARLSAALSIINQGGLKGKRRRVCLWPVSITKPASKKKKKKKSPQTFSLLRLCFYLIHLFFSFFF